MDKIKIGEAASLAGNKVIRFPFTIKGRLSEAFVLKVGNKFVAYENRCRHLPLKLDAGEGNFFSPDGDHLICHGHNALYDPATGLCVRGPCEGESLRQIEITIENGQIYVSNGSTP